MTGSAAANSVLDGSAAPADAVSLRERISGDGGGWDVYDTALAVVSFALLGGVTATTWSRGELTPAVLVLAAAVALVRVAWLARAYGRPGSVRRDLVFFVVHLAGTGVLCVLEPSFGSYAWIGFVDAASVLLRWSALAGIAVTAALVAGSVLDGPVGIGDRPLVFLALLAVNVAVAWTLRQGMVHLLGQAEQRRQMVETLQARQRQIERLQVELVEQAERAGRTDERARLSQELHDTVAQDLVGIVTQLEAAEHDGDWAGRGPVARQLARSGLTQTRRAVAALGDPALGDPALGDADRGDPALAAGFAPAVAQVCRQWSTVNGRPVGLDLAAGEPPPGSAGELLRICQESLANVARHAGAGPVAVRTVRAADTLRLEIVDGGAGFDPATVRPGFGLPGMARRAQRCGGELDVRSAPGRGTTVQITVPVPNTGPVSNTGPDQNTVAGTVDT